LLAASLIRSSSVTGGRSEVVLLKA
jgi:hypothetical protein